MTEPIPVPKFCRLEYLTASGWVVGHHGINLLQPHRYVERLSERGKVGRVTILDTGQVFAPDTIPDQRTLVPSTTHIPRVFDANTACAMCGEKHPLPHDGRCLL